MLILGASSWLGRHPYDRCGWSILSPRFWFSPGQNPLSSPILVDRYTLHTRLRRAPSEPQAAPTARQQTAGPETRRSRRRSRRRRRHERRGSHESHGGWMRILQNPFSEGFVLSASPSAFCFRARERVPRNGVLEFQVAFMTRPLPSQLGFTPFWPLGWRPRLAAMGAVARTSHSMSFWGVACCEIETVHTQTLPQRCPPLTTGGVWSLGVRGPHLSIPAPPAVLHVACSNRAGPGVDPSNASVKSPRDLPQGGWRRGKTAS